MQPTTAATLQAAVEVPLHCAIIDGADALAGGPLRDTRYAVDELRALLRHGRLDPSAHIYFIAGRDYEVTRDSLKLLTLEVQATPLVWIRPDVIDAGEEWYPNSITFVLFARMRGSKRAVSGPRSDVRECSARDLIRGFIRHSSFPGERVGDPTGRSELIREVAESPRLDLVAN